MYFNFALSLYLTLSSADNPFANNLDLDQAGHSVKALSGSRLFDTLKVMTS